MNREDIAGLLARLEAATWVPHIYKDGARYHVFSHCSYSDFGRETTATWCSEPNCETNKWQAKRLIDAGIDPTIFSGFPLRSIQQKDKP